jgi:DNA-directed RNA polymerase sigma subunit (sigma70/sigma32)
MGLDGYQPQPLQVVAKQMGVTRQRVGQIIDRARKDLRQELLR